MAKVLLYGLGEETETGQKLRSILRDLKIRAVTIEKDRLNETAGRLAATNGAAREAAPYDGEERAEFLLFCGLGGRQLDRLLAAMRRGGVSVARKAVLTEHNRGWTLCKLMDEIEREHAAFTRGGSAPE